MNKLPIILLFSILILLSFTTKETTVYICVGPKSKKYHYRKDCRGLKRCSTDIYEVTLKKAKKRKRTLCGYED